MGTCHMPGPTITFKVRFQRCLITVWGPYSVLLSKAACFCDPSFAPSALGFLGSPVNAHQSPEFCKPSFLICRSSLFSKKEILLPWHHRKWQCGGKWKCSLLPSWSGGHFSSLFNLCLCLLWRHTASFANSTQARLVPRELGSTGHGSPPAFQASTLLFCSCACSFVRTRIPRSHALIRTLLCYLCYPNSSSTRRWRSRSYALGVSKEAMCR